MFVSFRYLYGALVTPLFSHALSDTNLLREGSKVTQKSPTIDRNSDLLKPASLRSQPLLHAYRLITYRAGYSPLWQQQAQSSGILQMPLGLQRSLSGS